MSDRKRVSDIIGEEDIQSWKDGDVITIKAGTGAGKSYFVKNKLYDIAKRNGEKILMLIHRRNCVDQFRYELKKDGKSDTIDVRTYQSLEVGSYEVDLSQYKYIVSDEFHYFLSDASFSVTTDISLDKIIDLGSSVKLFMSATGEYMNKYMQDVRGINIIEYELENDFSFINALVFFNQDKTIDNFIDKCLKTDDKMIVFINDAERALDLHRKYEEHSLFNCSESNRHYRYVDEDKINEMLHNEMFEEQLLITTSVMEAGVNIKDKQVKHIVVDIEDFVVLTQCIGRRRIDWDDEDDKINLFVRDISKQQLEGRIRSSNERMEQAEYLKKYGEVEYAKKYGRRITIGSNVYLSINEKDDGEEEVFMSVIELANLKHKIDNIERVKMKSMPNGYKDYVKEKFGIDKYHLQEKLDEKAELRDYLRRREGDVMLSLRDREELIRMVNVRDGDNNRLIKGIGAINDSLEQNNIPFQVVSYSTSRIIDGKKRNFAAAWEVVRLTGLGSSNEDIPDISKNDSEEIVEVSGIVIGNKYKYKELCNILKEETKDGTSKPAQIKRWEKDMGVKFVKKPKAYLKVLIE